VSFERELGRFGPRPDPLEPGHALTRQQPSLARRVLADVPLKGAADHLGDRLVAVGRNPLRRVPQLVRHAHGADRRPVLARHMRTLGVRVYTGRENYSDRERRPPTGRSVPPARIIRAMRLAQHRIEHVAATADIAHPLNPRICMRCSSLMMNATHAAMTQEAVTVHALTVTRRETGTAGSFTCSCPRRVEVGSDVRPLA